MIDLFEEFYKSISSIDLAFSIITILSIIKCYRKGFVFQWFAGFRSVSLSRGKIVSWRRSDETQQVARPPQNEKTRTT